jgi:two-component system aerobic respiration control sensor histidine kinase ArcB
MKFIKSFKKFFNQKKELDTLRNQCAFLTNLIETMPGHVYWKDVNGIILGCNEEQARSAGLTVEEYIGKTDYQMPWKDQADTLRKIDLTVINTQTPIEIDEPSLLSSGKMAIFHSKKVPLHDTHGKIIGVLGVSFDVTEHRTCANKANQDKFNAEQTLKELVANVPAHIFWYNLDGVLLGCNDTQAKAFGYTNAQEMIGSSIYDQRTQKAEDLKIVAEVNQKILATGQPYTAEEPFKYADGTEAVFLSKKVPLRDETGNVNGILGIAIDITDRKKAERLALENEANKAQLIIQEERAHFARLDSMGALAVGIAHELNQPLSAINTFSGGVKRRLEALPANVIDESVIKALDSIIAQAKRAGEIIHELKDFLRKDSTEKQSFSINHVIKNVLILLKHKLNEQKIEVNLKLDSALPNITINKVQLEQVIFNLINNAMDAINTQHKANRVITIRTRSDDEHIRISVADNGIGILPEAMKKLFTPFNTTKAQGMGVGLTLCLNIVEKHLGKIDVVSRLGKGSIFHVILPR